MTELAAPRGLRLPRPLAGLFGLRRAWLGMDRNPDVLAFVQTRLGCAVLHLAFLLILWRTWPTKAVLGLSVVTLTLLALFPARRMHILCATGMVSLIAQPFRYDEFPDLVAQMFAKAGLVAAHPKLLEAPVSILFLLTSWAALSLQHRYRGNAIGSRPLTAQLVLFSGLVGLAASGLCSPLASAILWGFVGAFASNFWLLGYAFANLKTKAPASPTEHAGFIRPFWGGDMAPLGKGIGFLRKFEAKDSEALAATRLKALKLLVWGFILQKISWHAKDLFEVQLGLPTLFGALHAEGSSDAVDTLTAWTVLLYNFLHKVIDLAAKGHLLVALVRMAGFGIPRNTAKPLASRTLAEFWNRYFYYFKEILVDFFFYPAFTRYFKKQPRLRIAFATFCAAAVGNCLYHFLYELSRIPVYGFAKVVIGFRSYLIYTSILAAGIIISQLRDRRPKPEDGFLRYDVLPRVNVTLFFCMLMVFDDTKPGISLTDRFTFLLRLFGV